MTFLSWHLPSTGRCHCPGGICIKKLVCHARWWLLLCWGHSNKKFCGFSCRIFFGWLGTKYLFMSLINLVSTSVLTEASFLFLGLNWLSLLNAVWKFFFVDVERYLYSGMNYILQKQSGWPLIFWKFLPFPILIQIF